MFKKNETPFRGDSWGATFKHEMLLDDTHPKNRRTQLYGYSKDKSLAEPLDKEYLLLKQVRVCLLWIEDGRALSITFLKRPNKSFWWNHAHPILVLNRPGVTGQPDYQVLSFEDVTNEVDRQIAEMYEKLKAGQSIAEIPKKGSSHQGKAYAVVLEKHLAYGTFKAEDGLKEYCRNKIKENWNRDMLTDFFTKYRNVWFKN